MTDDPSGHAPAGTGIDGQDAVRPLLQDDLPPDPPPAFAGVVVVTQGQGRPGQFGEFLSVMRAAALVHGLIVFFSLPGENASPKHYPKRSGKVSDKKRSFCGFFAAGRSEESAIMVHSWPLCGRVSDKPVYCDGGNAKKRIFCGQKAAKITYGVWRTRPVFSVQPVGPGNSLRSGSSRGLPDASQGGLLPRNRPGRASPVSVLPVVRRR